MDVAEEGGGEEAVLTSPMGLRVHTHTEWRVGLGSQV